MFVHRPEARKRRLSEHVALLLLAPIGSSIHRWHERREVRQHERLSGRRARNQQASGGLGRPRNRVNKMLARAVHQVNVVLLLLGIQRLPDCANTSIRAIFITDWVCSESGTRGSQGPAWTPTASTRRCL